MGSKRIFALIDCNNFFVSCERVFRPDLEGKPVIVLSSNDGCAIARSNEAKELGIPMAAPAFKYKEVLRQHKVVQFSANFELYGDISRRITQLLTSITPRIEVYSVDESFLDLSELRIPDYERWGRLVKEKIQQWIGVPVSIGIAPTKTLAKLATDYAKKHPDSGGAFNFVGKPQREIEIVFQSLPLEDIWGVGRQLGPRLRSVGLASVDDIAHLSPGLARQLVGSKHGPQLVSELNGTCCYQLEAEDILAKSISRSRTFGEDTANIAAVEAALANFATKAAHRLRKQGQLTKRGYIFVSTNKHKPGYTTWKQEIRFNTPTADTGTIISACVGALSQIIQKGAIYHRAGVLLYDFVPANNLQSDLLGFVDPRQHERSLKRMQVIDGLNLRYGNRTVYYAAEDLGSEWEPKHNFRSPRYTSSWPEIPTAKINPEGL